MSTSPYTVSSPLSAAWSCTFSVNCRNFGRVSSGMAASNLGEITVAAAPESTSNRVFAPFKIELMLADTPERSLILIISIGGYGRAGPWSTVSAPLSFPIEKHDSMSVDPERSMVACPVVLTAEVVVAAVGATVVVVEVVASAVAKIDVAGVAATVGMRY